MTCNATNTKSERSLTEQQIELHQSPETDSTGYDHWYNEGGSTCFKAGDLLIIILSFIWIFMVIQCHLLSARRSWVWILVQGLSAWRLNVQPGFSPGTQHFWLIRDWKLPIGRSVWVVGMCDLWWAGDLSWDRLHHHLWPWTRTSSN